MLKDRHYYEDVYRTTFTAKLMKNGIDENNRPYVVLDNTAFYPTGGGQPHDTGTLNGIEVIDVEEIDGEILHFLAKEIELQIDVEGVIDWDRRFDHMQQHAGQHILTAAFVELFGIQTVSFHLGREIVTIDLDVSDFGFLYNQLLWKLSNPLVRQVSLQLI
ncbi:alanyl-tRNA editing protein [Sporosarcina sp. USHLN248]|uniref:alanyl-tRNA editing protein n=1 Tax=Sporosarcina sp. USHLN248 TaxID=3081300 RepID=UPI0030187E27